MATLTFDTLRQQVRGDVITKDDEGYEQARLVYNGMIDRRPSVIVRAVNAGDVIAAVNFAREGHLDKRHGRVPREMEKQTAHVPAHKPYAPRHLLGLFGGIGVHAATLVSGPRSV